MLYSVLKPAGVTSHDVVQQVKRQGGFKKVGHAGTLDPLATGVLVLATDGDTPLLARLSGAGKEYEATIAFGSETDTLDATGKVVKTTKVVVSAEMIKAAVFAFPRSYDQTVPAYSAVSVGGQRLYKLARRGEAVNAPARPVAIGELELLEAADNTAVVRMSVSKGFYVRSFARDLAERMGTLGSLTGLKRTRSGIFTESLSVSPETIANGSPSAFVVAGTVIRGRQLARQLGCPTANIAHAERAVALPEGVYASATWLRGKLWRSLSFVGKAHDDPRREHKVESHLLGFEGEFYGETITTVFIARIRDNRKFAGPAELAEQIKRDLAAAAKD